MTPNVQQFIDDAWAAREAETAAIIAAKDAEIVAAGQQGSAEYEALKQRVVTRYGEIALIDWPFDGVAWDETKAGTRLDLTGYVETFREDFNDLSRIDRKDGTVGPWFAAAHPNFDNGAAFLQPGDYYNPYSIDADGNLNITMRELSATTTPPLPPKTNPFKSGYIQTRNVNGQGGFVQTGGVFECRMLCPVNGAAATGWKYNGAWPAFWLLTDDKNIPLTQIRMEYDCFEGYSSDPKGFHCSVHYKRPGTLTPGMFPERKTLSNYVSMDKVKNLVGDQSLLFGATNGNLFNGIWRTFTTKFGRDTSEPTQQFVDGFEVCRMPTLDWMIASPVFMIVNLARRDENPTPTPQVMKVDYARALQRA